MVNVSIEQVAHHEAGHAVMWHALGHAFNYVRINMKADKPGETVGPDRPPPDSSTAEGRMEIEKEIMKCFAGDIAERLMKDEDATTPTWRCGTDDWKCAVGHARRLVASGEEMKRLFERLWGQAVSILSQSRYRTMLRALASELANRPCVGYADAVAIMTAAGDHGTRAS